MAVIRDLLLEAKDILRDAGVDEPHRESSSLMCFVLGKERVFLITNSEAPLTAEEEALFREAVDRRSRRVPFHHITGSREFYGLDFRVTPDVLIPRPETEFAVQAAIDSLRSSDHPSMAEVGVGSGCISVSILHHIHECTAVGLEISEKALEIASENALRHGVLSRLDLRQSDVFSALAEGERFDLIISNPPYIPAAEIDDLQTEVREHDPRIALTDGSDGLSIIRTIVAEAPRFLRPGGLLMIEIGFGQRHAVEGMFEGDLWEPTSFLNDLQSIPRVAVCRLAPRLG